MPHSPANDQRVEPASAAKDRADQPAADGQASEQPSNEHTADIPASAASGQPSDQPGVAADGPTSDQPASAADGQEVDQSTAAADSLRADQTQTDRAPVEDDQSGPGSVSVEPTPNNGVSNLTTLLRFEI